MTSRLGRLTLCVWLLPAVALAQPIHNHPQKAAYASPAEYPPLGGQQHWMKSNGDMGHLHLDTWCPYLGSFVVGDVVTCRFAITVRNANAQIVSMVGGLMRRWESQIIFDATGTSTPPLMVGDPNPGLLPPPAGIRTWGGQFAFTVPADMVGMTAIDPGVRARVDDGTQVGVEVLTPIWGAQGDPTGTDPRPGFAIFTHFTSATHPDTDYGTTIIATTDPLPLVPVTKPWTMHLASSTYGGSAIPTVTTDARVDLDLHNNIPGTTLWSVPGLNIEQDLTFDPATQAIGTHKYAVLRSIQNEGDMWAALFVVLVPIGDGSSTPPPPPPPTPPPPAWTTFGASFQRLVNQIRVCDPADGQCLVLGTVGP